MKQPEYKREEGKWRKYRETDSAAKTLRSLRRRGEKTDGNKQLNFLILKN